MWYPYTYMYMSLTCLLSNPLVCSRIPEVKFSAKCALYLIHIHTQELSTLNECCSFIFVCLFGSSRADTGRQTSCAERTSSTTPGRRSRAASPGATMTPSATPRAGRYLVPIRLTFSRGRTGRVMASCSTTWSTRWNIPQRTRNAGHRDSRLRYV